MAKNNNFKYMNTAIAAAVVASGVGIVAPQATEASSSLSDVKAGTYYYDAVTNLVERGIINGLPNGTFSPDQTATRGEIAVVLAKILNLDTENVTDPGFPDVKKDRYYYGAIAALKNAGYIKGGTDGQFHPEDNISRYHLALMIEAAFDLEAENVDALPFKDVADFYKEGVAALYDNKVTIGKSATIFDGNANVSRAEMAVFIARAEQVVNPTLTISEVTKSSIQTNKGEYSFSSDIASIFTEENAAALKNAEMKVKIENGQIVEIQSLTLNTSGTETEPVVFDGGNAVVKGNLTINADQLLVKNLTVNENVIVTDQVKNNFTTDGLDIKGELIVAEAGQAPVAAVKLFALATTTNDAKLNLTNTTVKALNVQRDNIDLTSDTKLPEVKVARHVSSIKLNSKVGVMTVNNEASLQISGTGSIDKVNVQQPVELNLGLSGNVGELNVANKDAKVTLGENATIEKLVVPTDAELADVIVDYDTVKGNITEVVDEAGTVVVPGTEDGTGSVENPDSGDGGTGTIENPTTPVDQTLANVSDIDSLLEALADDQVQTINVTGNISATESIVIDRAVKINADNHTINFTDAAVKTGIVVMADNVEINDLTVAMTEQAEWQGAYAVQVYDAQNVKLNNFTGSGADAALLVNASEVELTGTTTVSGNEFGGIEVSKGTAEGLSNSTLTVTGDLVNDSEEVGQPTIWLVNGQGTVEGNVPAISNTTIKADQTQYYLTTMEAATSVDVANLDELKTALSYENVQTINVTADIEAEESIVIDRAVEINGNDHTINFTKALGTSGIVVMHDDVAINDLTVAMAEQAEWQGAYAVQVYDAQNVTLNNFTGSGADAALLVNASEVEFTGTTTVSGNEFGGIEVSKGTAEGLSNSTLTVTGDVVNATEKYAQPTIWLVNGQGTVNSDIEIFDNTLVNAEQTQYYLSNEAATTVEVANLAQLKAALSNENINTINVTADIEAEESIVIDRAVEINGNDHTINFANALGQSGIVVMHDDVVINDLTVAMAEQAEWQGAYAVQVYDAQNVTLNNFTGSGADAALLVNASEVELTGTTTVSGNEFGGIEVSKGAAEGLSDSTLIVTGELVNATEKYAQPTIWLVNGQGSVTSDIEIFDNTLVNAEQTQYYLSSEVASSVEVANLEQLKTALSNEEIQTINVTADIPGVTESIVIDHAVTINGNHHTISFTEAVQTSGIVVMSDDVAINDLTVAMTQVEGWQGAYAVQVYDAQNVTLNNLTASGADAALLVNASNVALTGTTTVSGNEFGGIEVSKGTEAGLVDSSLNVAGTLANADEAYGEPTIWLVHNQDEAKTAQGTVSGDEVEGMATDIIVKQDGSQQTHFYLNSTLVETQTAE